MKKALVTLAIGDKYIANFKRFCYDAWKTYTGNHNLDLVVMTHVLDDSVRAQSRSPAWQKCLILSQKEIEKYDQVAWVDADIVINPRSPDVFGHIPIETIGAVDAYATPNREDCQIILDRSYQSFSKKGIQFIKNLSATDYHRNFGLPGEFESVVQTGVLVLSPKHHRTLLEQVYHTYEDKGAAYWNYEMRPLSYEILTTQNIHWLNPKFNMPWPFIKQYFYPFLNTPQNTRQKLLDKILRKSGLTPYESLKTKCATVAFLNNFFLHFAGCAGEMRYVNQNITSVFDI